MEGHDSPASTATRPWHHTELNSLNSLASVTGRSRDVTSLTAHPTRKLAIQPKRTAYRVRTQSAQLPESSTNDRRRSLLQPIVELHRQATALALLFIPSTTRKSLVASSRGGQLARSLRLSCQPANQRATHRSSTSPLWSVWSLRTGLQPTLTAAYRRPCIQK